MGRITQDHKTTMTHQFSFMEFFAGGGLARLGLGPNWRCLMANDIDSQKCAAYRANFGGADLLEGDIAEIGASDLPSERADLAWASFPCQDLSLAGGRGGIKAARSGAFFEFWRLVETLAGKGAAPKVIVIENVLGLLTSNGGRDLEVIVELMASAGYAISASILDAKQFTPQSRPRLFIYAFSADAPPKDATQSVPAHNAPPAVLEKAVANLPKAVRERWVWLDAAPQTHRNIRFADIVEWNAPSWHDNSQTQKLLAMMTERQRTRIDKMIRHRARRAGAAFRRTRTENGAATQRVEARFDGLAGCLRTPAGGSSRQIVFAIENGTVRSRLLTPHEAALLMGLPDTYVLPENATAALKLCGDGVCVPVVRWIAENVLEPALKKRTLRKVA